MKWILSSLLALALLMVAAVSAATPNWDIRGTWNLDFNTGGTDYLHTMIVQDFDRTTGEFTGTGSWNADPIDYPWSVTGTVSGDEVTFHILYGGTGNPGYTVDATGEITPCGFKMSGSATGPGQTFAWTGTGQTLLLTSTSADSAAARCIPRGSKLVLDVNHKVVNDQDRSGIRFWALTDYVKHVQVWQDPTTPSNLYVLTSVNGRWMTFAGATSPGAAVTQSQGANQTFQGRTFATITGTLNPTLPYPTFGSLQCDASLGSVCSGKAFDFRGTEEKVVTGIVGPKAKFSVMTNYFPGYGDLHYLCNDWTYHYGSQIWEAHMYGSTGDIVV